MRLEGQVPRLGEQAWGVLSGRPFAVVESVACWGAVAHPVVYRPGLLLVDIEHLPLPSADEREWHGSNSTRGGIDAHGKDGDSSRVRYRQKPAAPCVPPVGAVAATCTRTAPRCTS